MYKLQDKTKRDFLAICENICLEIKKLKKYFGKFGLELHLSGSGLTVFCQGSDYQLVKKKLLRVILNLMAIFFLSSTKKAIK